MSNNATPICISISQLAMEKSIGPIHCAHVTHMFIHMAPSKLSELQEALEQAWRPLSDCYNDSDKDDYNDDYTDGYKAIIMMVTKTIIMTIIPTVAETTDVCD